MYCTVESLTTPTFVGTYVVLFLVMAAKNNGYISGIVHNKLCLGGEGGRGRVEASPLAPPDR